MRDVERVLGRVLELAGERLGMDVAWVSDITGGDYRVRALAGDGGSFGLEPGGRRPLEETYCARMLARRLPSAIPDAAADPRTAALPATAEVGIGAYVGVPVRVSDGSVYGTLCCLSHAPEPALGEKDVRFLELLAQVAAEELDRERAALDRRQERRERVEAVIAGEGLGIAFQPIVSLPGREVAGVEALARFAGTPVAPPVVFAEAEAVGLGRELELATIRAALRGLDELPDGVYLSLNASPDTACSAELDALLEPAVARRVLLEITEQAPIGDYARLLAALARLRERGIRVAVDDAGAGYASMRHILRLAPEAIKLDMSLTRDIDTDPARLALAVALAAFADRVGATLIAEGVETPAELDTIAGLGIAVAQGNLLGPPVERR